MYVRSISFRAHPEVTAEQAAGIYDALSQIVAGAEGFLGSTFMMNPETMQAVSLSFWRDRECGAAAGPLVLPRLLATVHQMVVAPPDITGYDVIAQSFTLPEPESQD